MLSVREKGILEFIIFHCERVEEKVVGKSYDQFAQDTDLQDIICFNIFQIGELINTLSQDFKKKHGKQPWIDIVGMRNIIAHGYGTVKMDRIWKSATTEVKPLREYLEQILNAD